MRCVCHYDVPCEFSVCQLDRLFAEKQVSQCHKNKIIIMWTVAMLPVREILHYSPSNTAAARLDSALNRVNHGGLVPRAVVRQDFGKITTVVLELCNATEYTEKALTELIAQVRSGLD